MSDREQYTPGPATGAEVRKGGEKPTLLLVRERRHPPAKVWQALAGPSHRREWVPFDANGSLGAVGRVKLTPVGAPAAHVLVNCLRDQLDGSATADMANRFTGERCLYG